MEFDIKTMKQILADTAYVRTGGSDEEKRTAEYIASVCKKYATSAYFEDFAVDMATMRTATLTINGKSIPCRGYLCCGSGEVEAELYYLRSDDKYSLSLCRGKIVIFDGYLGYWKYRDLLDSGAVGFISYDGNANYADSDIDTRELRSFVSKGSKILGVNINAKDAIKIIKGGAATAKITIDQVEYEGTSRNVILDLPGEIDSYIVLTAHYDSTSLSTGAYDNMSGCIGLLYMADYFSKVPHRYGLRFIFCGSEERGLLGSKAYCEAHSDELDNIALCVNLDMIGCIMGKFVSCSTAENQLCHYISYMGLECGFPVHTYQGVYSSDSTPFSDKGIPSVSFARHAPSNTATIHNSYDTKAVMSEEQLEEDCLFITRFVSRMANAALCPVARKIPDNMLSKLDEYLCRKRPQ